MGAEVGMEEGMVEGVDLGVLGKGGGKGEVLVGESDGVGGEEKGGN